MNHFKGLCANTLTYEKLSVTQHAVHVLGAGTVFNSLFSYGELRAKIS